MGAVISFPEEEGEALEIKYHAQGYPFLDLNMVELIFEHRPYG